MGVRRSHYLAWEIALVLLIKLFAIVVIKSVFFSDPVGRQEAGERVNEWLGVQSRESSLDYESDPGVLLEEQENL